MSKQAEEREELDRRARVKSNSNTPTGGISDEGMRALEEALKKTQEEGTLPPMARLRSISSTT